MKSLFIFITVCTLAASSFAQKQTFDITTYTSPIGWKKEVKEDYINYTIADNKKKIWCRITIYKSTNSKGSIEQDFESEWQELVSTTYKIADAPQVNEVQEGLGWKIKAGGGNFTFNNSNALAMLTTMSGFNRCVSIVAITNSKDYIPQIQSLIESVDLIKPKTPSSGQAENPQQQTNNNDESTSIVGLWGKSNNVSQVNNRFGTYSYNKQQYTFNSNGTYRFTGKNYSEQYDETLLIKESGTYLINGNNLTINPKNSVIEAWSKKNGGDNWNQLKTSQNRTLEKIIYQFTIVEKTLVLQAAKETVRDGRFSSGYQYSYGPPSTFTTIKLPGE